MDVDRPLQHQRIAAERGVDQFGARKDPARLANQRFQAGQTRSASGPAPLLDRHAMPLAVDHHALAHEHVRVGDVAFAAPQQGPRPASSSTFTLNGLAT